MSLLVSGPVKKLRGPLFQSNLMLSWKEGQIDREANVQKSSHPPLPEGAFPSAKPLNSVLIHLAAPFLRYPFRLRNKLALPGLSHPSPTPRSPASQLPASRFSASSSPPSNLTPHLLQPIFQFVYTNSIFFKNTSPQNIFLFWQRS